MKLVIVITSNKDADNVVDKLAKSNFRATKISTTGQFLADGHSCIFIGVEDERANDAVKVLESSVTKRVVKSRGVQSTLTGTLLQQPVDVEEFGGVAFIVDVEDYISF